MRFAHLFTACALLSAAQITAVSAADPVDNPLLKESALPYHYPPFDKIKDAHFVPAIEAGMREQLKEVALVANNSEIPTFENTVVALERTGRLLDRAEQTFSNLNACNTNPTLKKINAELATLQTQFEQDVLKEKNASSVVVDRKEELAGLSDSQMATVTNAAKAEHKDGKFVIQMQNTTGQPLLGSLQNRQLRERIMRTSLGR